MEKAIQYKEIAGILKSEILGGKYAPNETFPSSVALTRRFRTTRATIRRALEELTHECLIRSHQGRGTIVTRQGAARKIGLMIPGTAYSEFFQPIVNAISCLAQKHGYTLIFSNITAQSPVKRIAQARNFALELVKEGVAGVIFQPLEFIRDATSANREVVAAFDQAKIPVVLIDYDIVPPPNRSSYDLVGINNYQAGYRMAQFLISKGAHKIDFMMRPDCAWSVHGRCDGVLAATMKDGKSTSRVLVAEPDDKAAIRKYLRKGRPNAIICGNDTTAAKLKQTLESFGLRIPRDLLLAGFDDLQIAALLTPPLTTIHQPCAEIGEAAFVALLSRMNRRGDVPRELYLDAPLVARESTGK